MWYRHFYPKAELFKERAKHACHMYSSEFAVSAYHLHVGIAVQHRQDYLQDDECWARLLKMLLYSKCGLLDFSSLHYTDGHRNSCRKSSRFVSKV